MFRRPALIPSLGLVWSGATDNTLTHTEMYQLVSLAAFHWFTSQPGQATNLVVVIPCCVCDIL
jgi:hypothetical protein